MATLVAMATIHEKNRMTFTMKQLRCHIKHLYDGY